MRFIGWRLARSLSLRATAALALALSAVLPDAAVPAVGAAPRPAPAASGLAQGDPPGGDLLPFDLGTDALLARAGLALDPGSSIRIEAPGPNVVLPAGVQQLGFLLGPGQGPTSPHCASLRPRSGGTIAGFTLVRAGVRNGASTPAWAMRAFDAAGTLLGGHGEGSYPDSGGYLGFPAGPAEFWMAGEGIARVEVCTHNRVSTFGAVPLAGLRVVLGGPAPAPPPTPAAPLGREEPIGTVVVPATGGMITATDGSGGVIATIAVPPGALGAAPELTIDVGILVDMPTTRFDEVAADHPWMLDEMSQYVQALNDRGTEEVYHPTLYPAYLAAAEKTLLGPPLVLGPSGQQFQQPLRVTVPLPAEAADAADDSVVVLLESRRPDGSRQWELIADVAVDPAAGTLGFDVRHFSDIWIWKITKNLFKYPFRRGLIAARGDVDTIRPTVPANGAFRVVARTLACSGRPWRLDRSRIHNPGEVLEANYRGGPPRAAQQDALRAWVLAQPNGSVSMESLFLQALELEGGDVYQALLAAQAVTLLYRDMRFYANFQSKFTPTRGDTGGDESGARYHFFGTAVHAFAYEHSNMVYLSLPGINARGDYVNPHLHPRTAIELEEGIESGDILSDTREFVVDLVGSDFGRDLYRQVAGRSPEALTQALGLNPADCPPSIRPPTANPGLHAYILVGIGLVLATEEDVRTRPSCRWTGGGTDCTRTAQIDSTYGGPYADVTAARADLKSRMDCFNGYWGLFIKVGDKNAWLQNNVGASDCKTVTQL